MNVVHIGTADNSGGAARAAFRLHLGLQAAGIHSTILSGYSVEHGRPDVATLPNQKTLFRKALKFAVNEVEQRTGLEYMLLPWKRQFLSHPFVTEAAVVNLHNLHGGFFSPDILPQLSRLKKIVWTVHDQWPLTGHCYFPDMYSCSRWKAGCGSCPGLRQEDHYPLSVDTTRFLWKRKRSIYAQTSFTLVAQSQWTMAQIRSSPLMENHDARLIPYGLDTQLFSPMERAVARQVLRIHPDRVVLFFSAVGLLSERKGWAYLKQALLKARARSECQFEVMVAGDSAAAGDLTTDVPVHHLGYVRDDRLMALAYNAADVFVGASIVESFGQVFSEALSCGTPAVAFDTSGVRDIVRHMETGYLARLRDTDDLANGICLLLNDRARRSKMSERCRQVAEQEYSAELQASRYANLYRELLDRNGSG